MASFTAVKYIGSGQTYTTLASWESDAPTNYTTAKKFTATTFSGNFTQAETINFSPSGAVGKHLDSDNSTYIGFAVTSGTPASGDTATGATSGKTCVLSGAATHTGVIWEGQVYASTDGFSLGSTLTIGGGTCSSTAYAHLTTRTGASFRDNANVQTNALRYNSSNGAYITCTDYYSDTISVTNEYTHISKLQINHDGPSSSSYTVENVGTNPRGLEIDFCIIESPGAAVLRLSGDASSNPSYCRNTLLVRRQSSAGEVATSTFNTEWYNCTLVVPSDFTAATQVIYGAYNTCTMKNCALFGSSNTSAGSSTFTFTTCYVEDASPPSGCTTATYNTTQFVNITDSTRDYRIPTGSALKDAGTTDTTNGPIDIAGTARPSGASYDVGCWEFVSAAAGYKRSFGMVMG